MCVPSRVKFISEERADSGVQWLQDELVEVGLGEPRIDACEPSLLYCARARYFDPGVGRWLDEEPVGYQEGDTNLYRYVSEGSSE